MKGSVELGGEPTGNFQSKTRRRAVFPAVSAAAQVVSPLSPPNAFNPLCRPRPFGEPPRPIVIA